jgi:hypothetical protein
MLPIVGFLACQILGIVRSQIEIEIYFSLVNILTNLKRYCLYNLEKFYFLSKNWLNDPRVGCKPPSNLRELIQTYLNFEAWS